MSKTAVHTLSKFYRLNHFLIKVTVMESKSNSKLNNDSIKGKCNYFVMRKKRYCRMTVSIGKNYCGEHLPATDDPTNSNFTRVTCPLDSKHSVSLSKLEKHLKVCNARTDSLPLFIVPGINLGDINTNSKDEKVPLCNVDIIVLKNIINKINTIYETLLHDKVKEVFLQHSALDAELNEPGYGKNSLKHLLQTAALTGLLKEEGLLGDGTCYIEFGGGRGQLTYWIAQITKEYSAISVVLVDKASHRHKKDNKLDNIKHRVLRIKADIADLVLGKIEPIAKAKEVVALSKHLCGAATDLAFRCIVNDEDHKVSSIVFAFCCHHRCNWASYIGKEFLFKNDLTTEEEFNIMCAITSWGTCGSGISRERQLKHVNDISEDISSEEGDSNTKNVDMGNHKMSNTNKIMGLTQREREHIGRRCKLILDYGRVSFLSSNGFDCDLRYYVKESLTPENVCVVAKRSKKISHING